MLRLGTALLLACSMVITAKQYFGEFIHCNIHNQLNLKVPCVMKVVFVFVCNKLLGILCS